MEAERLINQFGGQKVAGPQMLPRTKFDDIHPDYISIFADLFD